MTHKGTLSQIMVANAIRYVLAHYIEASVKLKRLLKGNSQL